jgi:hypothetical protein
MFKKLARLFSKNGTQIKKVEEEPEPAAIDPLEEEKPLPDVIEVPWKDAAPTKNFDDHIGKIHDDLKIFLYKTKLTEKKLFIALDKTSEALTRKKESLRELYGVPGEAEYEYILPDATGRSGFFKKKN